MNLIVQKQLSPVAFKFLKDDFYKVYNSLGITDRCDDHFKTFIDLYNQPGRYYHNLSHLYNFLQVANKELSRIKHPELFKIAIWLHDAIYIASQKDNELQSNELFQQLFKSCLNSFQIEYVSDLILSTEGHKPQNKQTDCALFLDIDLIILAAPTSIYQSYSDAVWNEYKSSYPWSIYKLGRKKVLKAFLKRSFIYFTPSFQQKYEQKARNNIQLELNTTDGLNRV